MRLTVFSHKPCWQSSSSASGYATDGGFPFQMRALSELFEATTLVVPCLSTNAQKGEIALTGQNISIRPLTYPAGQGLARKLRLPFWLARNSVAFVQEIRRADAIHTPIPGDIGTLGLLIAFFLRKPLFVRHCGNWFVQRTAAERFWKWSMERFAGGRNVALATGGATEPPSRFNESIKWIFSTSLTEQELRNSAADRGCDFLNDLRLIIVCRQEPGKGVDTLIESMPLILDQFPQATLDVVGDGSALAELKLLATSLDLNGRVQFHGKLDHDSVMTLLRQAHLFCYPTKSEGFPKVVLEAMACGLPIITTPVSVLPQLVGENCGGVLINKTDPAALAAAVRTCARDVRAYQTMSAQAKKTADQYSLERWRDTIGDILKSAWGPLKADV